MPLLAFAFRLGTLRPIVEAGAALGLAVALVAAGLQVASVARPLASLPRAVTGTGFLDDNRQRVQAAVQVLARGQVPDGDQLGVIVGISNVREDIDMSVVGSAGGPHWHFLGLGAAGVGMADVVPEAQIVLDSPLRPNLVLIGLSLHQLVDARPGAAPVRGLSALGYLRRLDLRNAFSASRDSLWVYTRRQDVSIAVTKMLDATRSGLLSWVGAEPALADDAAHSPWREMIKSDWPTHFSAATLRDEEQFFRGLGALDPATYSQSPRAAAMLVDLVRAFRKRGSRVIILLLPSNPLLRAEIPTVARPHLDAVLEDAFPHDVPPVWEMCRDITPSGFVDLSHLNGDGSARCSLELADRIRAVGSALSR